MSSPCAGAVLLLPRRARLYVAGADPVKVHLDFHAEVPGRSTPPAAVSRRPLERPRGLGAGQAVPSRRPCETHPRQEPCRRVPTPRTCPRADHPTRSRRPPRGRRRAPDGDAVGVYAGAAACTEPAVDEGMRQVATACLGLVSRYRPPPGRHRLRPGPDLDVGNVTKVA